MSTVVTIIATSGTNIHMDNTMWFVKGPAAENHSWMPYIPFRCTKSDVKGRDIEISKGVSIKNFRVLDTV